MSKPELMLIPGLLCTEILWTAQIAAFRDSHTITIADHRQDDTIPAIAQRILKTAPDRFSLSGLSMGGYIAMEIWRQAPERVERLALLDTRSSTDSDAERQRRHDFIALAEKGRFTGIHERLMPLFIHEDRLQDRELVGAVTRMAEDTGKQGFIRQSRALLDRADTADVLRTVTVPTLVLCGRQDALTPVAMHEAMAECVPGAKLTIIEDCGHLSTMERPDAVNAAMREWLEQ